MFNGKRKTIGVFLNRAEKEYQSNMSSALIKYAAEADYNILFFTSYEIREVMNHYDVYGNIIVDFAPIEDMDGVVIALDTYDKSDFRDKLLTTIKDRANCPVVSFREKVEDCYSVVTDANYAVGDVLWHLYHDHGFRKIAFMAGYEGHYDSSVRLEIYKEFMNEHDLPVYDNYIFYGDMWKTKGEEALDFFMSDPERIPEAVVCANDNMARSLADAAFKAGLKVPGDLAVTGVDNEAISYIIDPKLTSIGFDIDRMAKETIDIIRDVNEGVPRSTIVHVPADIRYRESCGCHPDEEQISSNVVEYYYRENLELTDKHALQNFFRIDMGASMVFDDILDIISDNITINGDVKEFYLCLLGERDEFGFPLFSSALSKKADLILSWKNGEREPLEAFRSFDTRDILPAGTYGDEPLCYYITMLHNSKDNFGFTVINFKDIYDKMGIYYHNFNLTIGITLSRYFMYKRAEVLMDIYEKDSLTDYMTGMSNRRGGENYFSLNRDKWIKDNKELIFMSIDVDLLKMTNDTFGHEAGDDIIKGLAGAIRKVTPADGCSIRMGGDEFLLIAAGDDAAARELEKMLQDEIDLWNKENERPYELSASAGFATVRADETLDIHRCIRKADQVMYQHKSERRRKRD